MRTFELRIESLVSTLRRAAIAGLITTIVCYVIFAMASHSIIIEPVSSIFIGIMGFSIAAIFINGGENATSSVYAFGVGAIKSLAGSLFASAFCLNPVWMALFLVKAMILAVIGGVIFLFMAISFPITALYTLVMYFLERSGKVFSDSLISLLDILMPASSAILTLMIVINIAGTMQ